MPGVALGLKITLELFFLFGKEFKIEEKNQIFSLLQNKETSSYQRVFQYLKDANVTPPGGLKTDFEDARISEDLYMH